MKEKIKKIIFGYLPGFVLGVITAISISVIAATYFPSNDVTYDNTESGLSSTDVQGAIDELYKTCTIVKVDIGGQKVPTVDEGDGLYEDEYTKGRYVYKGADPNNYVEFANGDIWRIIAKETDGTYKIVRNLDENLMSSYDALFPDGTVMSHVRNEVDDPYCELSGCAVWCAVDGILDNGYRSGKVTTDSALNIYLNGEYYNNLDSSIKDYIVSHNWNVGPVYLEQVIGDLIDSEKKWNCHGMIGLINVSDLLLANSDESLCGTIDLSHTNDTVCIQTNWLDISGASILPQNQWWSINPLIPVYSDSDDFELTTVYVAAINGSSVTSVTYDGDSILGHMFRYVRPVVYLNSDITLNGSGTVSDPYVVE